MTEIFLLKRKIKKIKAEPREICPEYQELMSLKFLCHWCAPFVMFNIKVGSQMAHNFTVPGRAVAKGMFHQHMAYNHV